MEVLFRLYAVRSYKCGCPSIDGCDYRVPTFSRSYRRDCGNKPHSDETVTLKPDENNPYRHWFLKQLPTHMGKLHCLEFFRYYFS